MLRLLLVVVQLATQPPLAATIEPVPPQLREQLAHGFWKPACPVRFTQLRVLSVWYWGFDDRAHSGRVVVNADAARPLASVFRELYRMRFPIRQMQTNDFYGPKRSRPADGDVTAAFDCRQAVPSPCQGGTGTGSWSEHAYGMAIDVNPVENPYAGCDRTRDRSVEPYLDRSWLRRGMITPAVIRLFRSAGWGWGGDWTGSTKDYMHFSASGH
jgi:D-alanyl-D-alanine carboxypeptidase